MTTMNSTREQQLMEDFEWKLREMEKDHKKKMEERDRKAEVRLKKDREWHGTQSEGVEEDKGFKRTSKVPWHCILNQLRAYSHLPGRPEAKRLTRRASPHNSFRTSLIPFPCYPLWSVLHPTNCCSGPLQERISAVRDMVESELADSLIKVAEDRRVADEQLMEVSVGGGGEVAGLTGVRYCELQLSSCPLFTDRVQHNSSERVIP
ncbi:hypothetical protein E2C01_072513 [Portunus trituberculatus]|uniref:Uncharacterized protein n=1 Tax=Portunus trituberculatus TaxID=210409 RepID=A0A5B7I028_PORTR|nr:hypothetical protein [Portunus trituberculatus]